MLCQKQRHGEDGTFIFPRFPPHILSLISLSLCFFDPRYQSIAPLPPSLSSHPLYYLIVCGTHTHAHSAERKRRNPSLSHSLSSPLSSQRERDREIVRQRENSSRFSNVYGIFCILANTLQLDSIANKTIKQDKRHRISASLNCLAHRQKEH